MPIRVNLNGINELDFPIGVDSATTSGGVTTINAAKASASVFGIVEVDGSTITATGGVISAVGGSGNATSLQGVPIVATPPTTGQVLEFNGTDWVPTASAGGGTVTSVALAMPAEFTVSGSPITSSGTFTVTKANENANLVYAGPSSGSAAAPTFRSLVGADLPLATATTAGAVIPDNSTVTISGGVISAVSSSAVVRLGQVVVGVGGSPTITFSSIPGTYTNLRLVITGTQGSGGGSSDLLMQFNGDTGDDYDWTWTGGNGGNGVSSMHMGQMPGGTAGSLPTFVIDIPSYAGTIFNKVAYSAGNINTFGSHVGNFWNFAGDWNNTAAITQLTFTTAFAGSFNQGSTFTLYGFQ